MLIVGALATVYSFCYATGGLAELGRLVDTDNTSMFFAAEGKYDATLFIDIQGFNGRVRGRLHGYIYYINGFKRRMDG